MIYCFVLLCSLSAAAHGRPNSPQQSTYALLGEAKIQGEIQRVFYSLIPENAKEAWGLFSYGGWSNNGHIGLIKKLDITELYYAQPNTQKFEIIARLNHSEFAKFELKLKELSLLGDLDSGAFDGLQYEFVHFEKRKEGMTATQRVYMNNPQLVEGKTHGALIDALFEMAAHFAPPLTPAPTQAPTQALPAGEKHSP